MQLFVTGATGWIGRAVVPELLAHGHVVVGLARSAEAEAQLVAAGASAVRGDLTDLDVLRVAAAGSQGVVHLAFQHDIAFTGGFAQAADADRAAVEVMGGALRGSDAPFVLASGLLGLTPGRVATEVDGLMPAEAVRSIPAGRRAATALLALSLRGLGVRASVVRLAPTVHGEGDQGFMATLASIARETGVAAYPGEGANRWPAVHRSDVATLFRLAVEQAPAGTVLHAAGEEGVTTKAIAEAFASRFDLPSKSLPFDEVATHFRHLGGFIGLDAPASATFTQDLLGWAPVGRTLVEDIAAGVYDQ
jgi:nucleoside-diphosphate-sugar epimerase